MTIKNALSAFILMVACVFSTATWAQQTQSQDTKYYTDTVRMTISEGEELFIHKNLVLLAQKYNVDATKALILQAKLWPNPNISFTQGLYNSQTHGWLQTGPQNGEEAAQLSQLIQLAGKIRKQVKIAETNYRLSEDNFYNTLLSLKMSLRSSFFNIYYLRETAKVYDQEIGSLKTIVTAYKLQEGKGYIAESDIVRVQAQLYSLQNEYQVLIDSLNDQESQLRILLHLSYSKYVDPVVDSQQILSSDPRAFGLKTLLDSAYSNRADIKIARDNVELSQANYAFQRALSVPDITAAFGYDRQGSYIPNFNSVGFGIDIPIFNRNQGNIKSTQILIDYNKTQLEFTQNSIDDQIVRGLQKALDADKLYKQIDPSFARHFSQLAQAMSDNYMKRNVSLLNFLTFYDSYKQNIVQLNTILFNRLNALENLNFLTGTSFFNK